MIDIHRVGVIGAGQMGNGIAQVCALAGFGVALNDISEERVKAGIATINGHMARQVVKQAISENDRQAALGRIGAAPRIAIGCRMGAGAGHHLRVGAAVR